MECPKCNKPMSVIHREVLDNKPVNVFKCYCLKGGYRVEVSGVDFSLNKLRENHLTIYHYLMIVGFIYERGDYEEDLPKVQK